MISIDAFIFISCYIKRGKTNLQILSNFQTDSCKQAFILQPWMYWNYDTILAFYFKNVFLPPTHHECQACQSH